MISSKKFKIFLLLLGDFALFYFSLYLTLVLRYQDLLVSKDLWHSHQMPFFFIHLLWIAIFYIGGLYDINIFASFKNLFDRLIKTVAIAGVLAIFIFYLVPDIDIAPKTNLFIDVVFLAILLTLWRRLFWDIAGKTSKIKTLFFGASDETKDLFERLKNNPHIGYEPAILLAEVNHNLIDLIKQHNIQLIVASREIMQNEKAAKQFYETLPLGIGIISFENFYEALVEKIPIYLINETWFLENLAKIKKSFYEFSKRFIDIVLALFLLVPLGLLLPFIALAIKLASKGPVFFQQKRVGRHGQEFWLIKFRSMVEGAERISGFKYGGQDLRHTRVGAFLRRIYLDELPQIINILKGEMSFVGPRPERPEYVRELKQKIPFYEMRLLVLPGITGWAQIKMENDASVEDAPEKLQHDLYYIKNRSLVLDLTIAVKTLATILSRQGR